MTICEAYVRPIMTSPAPYPPPLLLRRPGCSPTRPCCPGREGGGGGPNADGVPWGAQRCPWAPRSPTLRP